MSTNKSSLIQLLQIALGVLFGVFVTLFGFQVRDRIRGQKAMYGEWRKLNLILSEVEKNYVDTLDFKGMTDAAVIAALAKLDPHSVYMPPVEKQESDSQLAGNFDGIGIQFNVPNDTAVVLEVIPGGPSEKVGLLPGDRLIKIDDYEVTDDTELEAAVKMIRGEEGKDVVVTVRRDGEKEDIPITITRAVVEYISVSYEMLQGNIGYIQVDQFIDPSLPVLWADLSRAADHIRLLDAAKPSG